ncbi:hypothetical protein ARMGADRAFT_1048862 [Armillaria gallica]|uniref:Uncharacterized protein n=1 Tax=Armillaria gallica TaxID=47427 RepID=A0A2H3CDR2_ARMGA|nr:hypothetical protein ARMGADRAFT_1048862 [Armillaria gallica]
MSVEGQSMSMNEEGPLVEEAPAKVKGAEDVEHMHLWLPSALTAEQQALGCKGNIVKIEEDLREAQCFDTLDTIRGVSCTKRDLYSFWDKNIWGQVWMTHAAAFMMGLTHKLEVGAAKYRVAQVALLALRGLGEWEERLRVLQASDIRTMDGAVFCIGLEETDNDISCYRKRKKDTENFCEGEGFRTVSWIWTTEGALGDGSNAQLHSEMQRCLKSLEQHALRWESARDKSDAVMTWEILLEGMRAYADSQAAVNCALAASFQALWLKNACKVE